jgi:hypothetical protein
MDESTDSRFIDFFADEGPTAEQRMEEGLEDAVATVKKEATGG